MKLAVAFESIKLSVQLLSWSRGHCPDLNPVTPLGDVLKNCSTDNALPLVWALSVTKWERVHCWCCIPAGTIPLFSRLQSGRLNWTPLPPSKVPPSPPPPYTPLFPLCSQTYHPNHPPTTHSSSHTCIPWSPVLIWVKTFWVLVGGEGGEGAGLTQGRQEEKQWALAALS